MARPVKRNRLPLEELNYTNVANGVYLDEVQFGMIHELKKQKQSHSEVEEFVFKGKLHKGEVKFICGDRLKEVSPILEGFNHGYTLEGKAQELFEVRGALDIFSKNENRSFNYTKEGSTLVFVGSDKEEVTLYVTFYENCYGEMNNRWAVIYA